MENHGGKGILFIEEPRGPNGPRTLILLGRIREEEEVFFPLCVGHGG